MFEALGKTSEMDDRNVFSNHFKTGLDPTHFKVYKITEKYKTKK